MRVMKRFSFTARLRLTLLLSVLFLSSGSILLLLNYSLVRYRLQLMPVVLPLSSGSQFMQGEHIPGTKQGDTLFQIPISSSDVQGELQALQARIVTASLRELLLQSGLTLALMAGLVVLLSWLIAGRVLRPVQSITALARRLSEEQLHERIGLQGPHDELKELADTFDNMLARLERAFALQGRFAASASHELRTPLTIMRTEVDITLADPQASVAELRAMGEIIRGAVERSERLIDGLLMLARSEQSLQGRTQVDLAACVHAAIEQIQAEAQAQHLRWEIELQTVYVAGDVALLERLVANLVENAVHHNHRQGWIRLKTWANDGMARLMIENSGPHIAAEQAEALFLPFRRLGGDRIGAARGTGLGLTIARATAEAHNGTLVAHARPDGGLRIELSLPHLV